MVEDRIEYVRAGIDTHITVHAGGTEVRGERNTIVRFAEPL